MIATLICRTSDGRLQQLAGESTSAMLELAKEVRISGVMDGVPVVGGVVLNDNPSVVRRFRCDRPAVIDEAPRRKRGRG